MLYPALQLPKAPLKLSKQDEQFYVWCVVRKKKFQLTPEEWVRQHVIHFLLGDKKIPIERINCEHVLNINGQKRRCDVIVIDKVGSISLIVECKAAQISIDEKVFLQTSNYVQSSQARYFWMTNGLSHQLYDCLNSKILEGFPIL